MTRFASLLALATATTATASPQTDAADRLIAEGLELAQRDDWADACARFSSARSLREDIRARGLEAGCHEKLGRLATAWRGFQRLHVLAVEGGDSEAATFAAAGIARLAPKLARLVVMVIDPSAPLVVTVDGHDWPRTRWGRPFEIDSGAHSIRIEAPGREPQTSRIAIVDGEQQHYWIDNGEPDRSNRRRFAGIAIAGAGAATMLVGTYFGVAAIETWRAAQIAGCTDDGRCSSSEATRLVRDADRRASIATWTIGSGLAVGAVGVALWASTRREAARRWTIQPMASPTAAGAQLQVVLP